MKKSLIMVLTAGAILAFEKESMAQQSGPGFHRSDPPREIVYTTLEGNIYRSKDKGRSWKPTTIVNSSRKTIFDKLPARREVVFTGLDSKEYRSFDGGVTFYDQPAAASEIRGSGVEGVHIEGELTPVAKQSVVVPFEIVSIVPNPTSGNARVTIRLDKASRVLLSVENPVNGQKRIIVDQFLEVGIHTMPIRVIDLQAGNYICTLRADNHVVVSNFTIVK